MHSDNFDSFTINLRDSANATFVTSDDSSQLTESAYLVCGVAGSNPSLNQQSKDKVKLMINSGSQRTACSVDFAKGYATDDTERAKLWDTQDQKIEAHGKKLVDVKFHGQANETLVPASIKVDVSDVAGNVASMGRLLRAGFDFHFTNHGHT